MKVFVCVIPDNELLGVFSTQEKAEEAIQRVASTSKYIAGWHLAPEEVEIDVICTDRIND